MEVGEGLFLFGVFVALVGVGVLWKQGLVHFGRKTGFAPVEIHNHFSTNSSAPKEEQPTASGPSEPSRW